MPADTELSNHRVNGFGKGAGSMASGGDSASMDYNSRPAAQALSSASSDAADLLQHREHDSDDEGVSQVYTGMLLKDIVRELKTILGSSCHTRPTEVDALSQLVHGYRTKTQQQEQLRLVEAKRTWLISKCSLPRYFVYLQHACPSCGETGHASDSCPQLQQQAASAFEGGEDGSEAGSSVAAGSKGKGGGKSEPKRSKKAKKQVQQAASSAGKVPAELSAAESSTAEAQAAGNGGAGAKAGHKSDEGGAPRRPLPVALEVEDDDAEDSPEVADSLLTLVSMRRAAADAARGGKAAQPTPQRSATEPARSGGTSASAPDADVAASGAASAKSAPAEKEPQQEPQQEPQPALSQSEEGRATGRRSRKGRGGGDERLAPTGQADGRTASMSRPGSGSGGRQDVQLLRRDRDGNLTQCFRCGAFGHRKTECKNDAVARDLWPKHPPQQQQAPRQQLQPPPSHQLPGQQQQQLQSQQFQQPQRAQPVSPGTQGSSSMRQIHSALGHAPAEQDSWASRTAVRVQPGGGAPPGGGGGYSDFAAPPVPDHFAAGGTLLPPPLQQQSPQHTSMLPPEQAPPPALAGEEDDDIMSTLLADLGVEALAVESPAAGPAAAWGGAGAGTWNPMSSMQPHPLRQLQQVPPPPPAVDPAELDRQRQEEEEQFQMAMEASIKEQRGFGGGPLQRDVPGHTVAGTAAGLANDTGEYNCFLNAIIQCVWRCHDFRDSILSLDLSYLEPGNGNARIVGELVALCRAMAEREGSPDGADTRPPVSPNGLREALSACTAFQMGEMNDAAEVLRTVYDALIDQGFRDLVTSCFGLDIDESVQCDHCGMHTHRHSYTQYFQQVPAASLRGVEEKQPGNTLGLNLLAIDKQNFKTCDEDMGGCGKMKQVEHAITGDAPKVFSIELAWQCNEELSETIADTLKAVTPFFKPSERYQRLTSKWQRLCAMVCYYGQHYMAFVLMRPPGGAGPGCWVLHDDANTTEVGNWDAVLHKCRTGRIQPSVLLYEDV